MLSVFRPFLRDAVGAGARDVAEAGARDVAEDAARTAASDGSRAAAESELHAAASDTVHETSDVAVRESAKTARQGIKSAPGIITASAKGTAIVAGAGYSLWKLNQVIDNTGKGLQNLGNGIQDGLRELKHDLDDLSKWAPSSIQRKVDEALHGAQNLGAGLVAPAQTGVTILVVLLGVVGAYEVYRLLR